MTTGQDERYRRGWERLMEVDAELLAPDLTLFHGGSVRCFGYGLRTSDGYQRDRAQQR